MVDAACNTLGQSKWGEKLSSASLGEYAQTSMFDLRVNPTGEVTGTRRGTVKKGSSHPPFARCV